MRWNGPSNICVPMIYCSMRRTIRIGSSTATRDAGRDFAGAAAQDRDRQSARDLCPAQGGGAMNIEVRAKDRTRSRASFRSSIATSIPRLTHEQMQAVPQQSMVELSADLRQPPRHGQAKGYDYPKIDAAGGAPRRLAAGRRPAGRAISISAAQQHLDFYGIDHGILNPLVADRAGRPERRAVDRARLRRERSAACLLDRHGSAAEVLRRGALRGRRRLRRRSPQARRQQGLRAGVPAEPHRRGGAAASATGRSTRPRSKPGCRSASTPSATAAGR